MKKIILTALSLFFIALPVVMADGVVNVQSTFNVKETADRLERILKEKGMTIFNRIKHSEGAANVGVEIRETELIIFGNPKVGSPLMKCQQTVAIDLPQKALIWKDGEGDVFISYNNPTYIQMRHNISGCGKVLAKIEKALSAFTKAAATK